VPSAWNRCGAFQRVHPTQHPNQRNHINRFPNRQGALLVKAVPPANLDASTESLFTSLVPDSRWVTGVTGVTYRHLLPNPTQPNPSNHIETESNHFETEPNRTQPSESNSAKALSKYTDLVDGVVRASLDRLAGATDAARIALRQVGGRSGGGPAPPLRLQTSS
jgi:hypothetical protein